MATVVDEFRAAREVAPPTNEREEKMHSTFESLLNSILTVFNKYGYEEFDAEIGSKLVPTKHQVAEVVEGEEDGLIVRQLKRGIMNKDGEVLRYVLFLINTLNLTRVIDNPYHLITDPLIQQSVLIASWICSTDMHLLCGL